MDQELQFERTEVAGNSAARKCGGCSSELHHIYYEAGGVIMCERCANGVRTMIQGTGSRLSRFGKALLLGCGAALLGALIWYAIEAFTGYQLGLVSILIGVLVGRAVRKGSGGRGGVRYQLLAVVLTYLSIVSTYIPVILKEVASTRPKTEAVAASAAETTSDRAPAAADQKAAAPGAKQDPTASSQPTGRAAQNVKRLPAPVRLVLGCVFLVGFAMVVPFLAGAQNIMGLLIIGFGLWEAWRVNRRLQLAITGPHTLASAPITPPLPPPL